jgi:hypothetical protein
MALSAGTHVGPYEILTPIGAGGMGEVYRARDAKLNRDVALKILAETFATDVDRLARFRREAQVLAPAPEDSRPSASRRHRRSPSEILWRLRGHSRWDRPPRAGLTTWPRTEGSSVFSGQDRSHRLQPKGFKRSASSSTGMKSSSGSCRPSGKFTRRLTVDCRL